MTPCYVIFFMDGEISYVTCDKIEEHAEKHGMNVIWGRGDAGELVRKDGTTPCRYFIGSTLK